MASCFLIFVHTSACHEHSLLFCHVLHWVQAFSSTCHHSCLRFTIYFHQLSSLTSYPPYDTSRHLPSGIILNIKPSSPYIKVRYNFSIFSSSLKTIFPTVLFALEISLYSFLFLLIHNSLIQRPISCYFSFSPLNPSVYIHLLWYLWKVSNPQ